MKKIASTLMVLLVSLIAVACTQGSSGTTTLILNPYAGVDWSQNEQVLAGLHTHTTHSDGAAMPHEVVDFYHAFEYGALAITDHDLITYPWTFSEINPAWEDRDPEALGMLAIPGNEYHDNNNVHHFVGLFTEYLAEPNQPIETTLEALFAQPQAVGFFAHPGRYWRIFDTYEPGEMFSPEWYQAFFEQYPVEQLIGMEIINRQNARPYQRDLWDRLLTELMPGRPIWGLGVDDYHGDRLGQRMNWGFTYHFMHDPTSLEEFRETLMQGRFYIGFTAIETEDSPRIQSIIVNERLRYIEIRATEYEEIRWYSGVDEPLMTSRHVHTGNRFYYGAFSGDYVRAEIIRSTQATTAAISYTQPFGFKQEGS